MIIFMEEIKKKNVKRDYFIVVMSIFSHLTLCITAYVTQLSVCASGLYCPSEGTIEVRGL